MKQSKQTGKALGGIGLPVSIPTPKLEGIPDAVRPFFEVGMKVQSEILELWGHRARAWLDWPDTCSSCKTVDDLTSAQSDYLAKMQRDYAHYMDGVLRDTMIEQDEFEEVAEKAEEEKSQAKTGTIHREAA